MQRRKVARLPERRSKMPTSMFREGMATEVAAAVHQELLRLAYAEDQLAADEAARVRYWEPCPPSVQGHRSAARLLRAGADLFAA